MTKVPEPGKVKTRLTPPLTAVEAAEINTCFLRDTASAIASACGRTNSRGVGIYTPVGGEAAYAEILPPGFFLIAQRGNGFGERLVNAIDDLLQCGFGSVCLINSDSPTVSPAAYERAANVLARSEDSVVIGPSGDGGYYLIGINRPHRELFENIEWSTERVLEQTVQQAAKIGLRVQLLPTFYDIDEAGTLSRLCSELLGDESSAAPATRQFLQQIVEREGRNRIWPQ